MTARWVVGGVLVATVNVAYADDELLAEPPASSAPMPESIPDLPPVPDAPEAEELGERVIDVKHETDEEEGEPKLSLPTEADRSAWKRPGFRLGLGFAYGELVGLRGAPDGRLIGPKLRAGLRLDESWSVLVSFEYTIASREGGLAGLRFAGTIDPTWHVTPNLSLALGFGFGGIVESATTRMDASPLPGELETSYTFPDAATPIAACSGVGAAGLARVEYAYVLGPRLATTIAFEVVGQWTGCVDDTGRVEPDTGKAIVRRQWWPHTGATLALGVTWR